jgi:pyruvate formate lyase activating enzyme
MKEARLYKQLTDDKVQCNLCAHHCLIADKGHGVCQVRENHEGALYTLVYGKVVARHVDPIEKKPLFHFYPGSHAYSIATPGCNFHCRWCQNAEISQIQREQIMALGDEITPAQVISAAQQAKCRSIAYTYTEPTIFFEYAEDTAHLAQEAKLANVFVTNGYMTEAMLEAAQPWLDAANVDLKGFRDEVYRQYVGARLQPVLDSLKKIKALNIWLEVTTLIVPGVNDDPAELRDAANFVAQELGPETPWHLSRFFPAYRMTNTLPTPLPTIERAVEIGHEAGLRYVYAGNVAGETQTTCHVCGQSLIRRSRYTIVENNISALGQCPQCSTPVAGVGMAGESM